MILEVTPDSLRDLAAAVHAAIKREPGSAELGAIENQLLVALSGKERFLDLSAELAAILETSLRKRAWDLRTTSESDDYADLADRISGALDNASLPLDS